MVVETTVVVVVAGGVVVVVVGGAVVGGAVVGALVVGGAVVVGGSDVEGMVVVVDSATEVVVEPIEIRGVTAAARGVLNTALGSAIVVAVRAVSACPCAASSPATTPTEMRSVVVVTGGPLEIGTD